MTVREDGLRDWAQSAGSFAKRTLKEVATVNPRQWSPGTRMAVWSPTIVATAAAFPHAALLGVGHPIGLGALNAAITGGVGGVLTKVGVKALELNRDVQDKIAGKVSPKPPGVKIKPQIRPVAQPSPAPRIEPRAAEQLGAVLNPASKPELTSYDRAQNALRRKIPRIARYVEQARERGGAGDYRGALKAQQEAQRLGRKAFQQYGTTLLKPDAEEGADLKSLIRHCDDLSEAIGDAGGAVTSPSVPSGFSMEDLVELPVVNKLGYKSNQNFDRQNRLARKMLAAKMGKQGFDVSSEPTATGQRSSQGPRSTPKPISLIHKRETPR